MITLKINDKLVSVEPGTTVLQAAGKLGFEIPQLCFIKEMKPATSCMICVVKDKNNSSGCFIPSCGALAEEGMDIETDSDEVLFARKTAIELLLSEHSGDCFAPCQRACPFHADIPGAIRFISKKEYAKASELMTSCIHKKNEDELRCWKQCEKACRRKMYDSNVNISGLGNFIKNTVTSANISESLSPVPDGDLSKNDTGQVQFDRYIFGKVIPKHGSIMRKISEEELIVFLNSSSKENQIDPQNKENGYNEEETIKESLRCFHCDCRKQDNCKLRDFSEQFQAKQSAFLGARIKFEQILLPNDVIFEPGKCIKCGICVQISENDGQKYGFTFLNRGFDLKVGVPFDKFDDKGLQTVINKCVEKCPTAALAFKAL